MGILVLNFDLDELGFVFILFRNYFLLFCFRNSIGLNGPFDFDLDLYVNLVLDYNFFIENLFIKEFGKFYFDY
jgi:hypothetical protein